MISSRILLTTLLLSLSLINTLPVREVYVLDTIGTDEILSISGLDIYNPTLNDCEYFQYNATRFSFNREYDFNVDFDKLTFTCGVLINGTSFLTINVFVNDTNDHVPTFNRRDQMVNVPENVNRDIHLLVASDPDLAPYNIIVYNITGENIEYFQFMSLPPVLMGGNRLDRETVPAFNFILTATDNDSNRSSFISVLIEVVDDNDNAPIFLSNRTAYSIQENQTAGYLLDTFTAQDADTDNNAAITYSLLVSQVSKGGNVEMSSPFQINSTTGQVHLSETLDYELFDTVEFTVQATDGGTPQQSSTIRIHVSVIDLLDTVYRIELLGNLVRPGGRIEIHENTIPSSGALPIINIVPRLADPVNLTLLNSTDNSTQVFPFYLNRVGLNSGWSLGLNATLDRELIPSYQFLLVTDCISSCQGIPVVSLSLFIEVLDRNDNPPDILERPLACIAVEEGYTGELGRLNASDEDIGSNAELSYFIIGSGDDEIDSYFAVNSSTGVVMVVTELDYEEVTQINTTLLVMDNGSPSLATNVVWTVCVINLNDNLIRFKQADYSTLFPLNAPLNAPLLSIQASDRDEPSIPIFYFLNSSDTQFSLDSTTGELRLNSCAAEQLNNTLLPVYASKCPQSDNDTQCEISHTSISIMTTLSYPLLQPIYSICLPMGTQVSADSPLLSINTPYLDPSLGLGLQIAFQPSILTSRGNDIFLSPNVSLQQLRDTCAHFSCNISLYNPCDSDSYLPSNLNVLLTQLSGQSLRFSSPSFEVRIAEEIPPSTLIIDLYNYICYTELSQVSFSTSLLPPAINLTHPGKLVLASLIDTDLDNNTSLYSFTAYAEAGASIANTTIYVTVYSVNDNAPTFVNPITSLNLNSSLAPGQRVAQILASDMDTGRDGDLTYILDIEKGFLVINNLTGEISLSAKSRDNLMSLGLFVDQPLITARSFNATVIAVDNGTLPLNASHMFRVTLDIGFMLLRSDSAPLNWPIILVSALFLLLIAVLVILGVSVYGVCRAKFWFTATFNVDSTKTSRVWDVLENPEVSFRGSVSHTPAPPPANMTPESSKSSGLGVSIDSSPPYVTPMTDAEIRHIIDSNRDLVNQLSATPQLQDYNEASPAPPTLAEDSELHLLYEDETSQANGDKVSSNAPPIDIMYANPDIRFLVASHSPQSSLSATSSYLSSVSHQRPRHPVSHREAVKKPQSKLVPLPSSSTPSFSQKVLAHSQQPEHFDSLDSPN